MFLQLSYLLSFLEFSFFSSLGAVWCLRAGVWDPLPTAWGWSWRWGWGGCGCLGCGTADDCGCCRRPDEGSGWSQQSNCVPCASGEVSLQLSLWWMVGFRHSLLCPQVGVSGSCTPGSNTQSTILWKITCPNTVCIPFLYINYSNQCQYKIANWSFGQ